jgi:ribonuclease HI
LAVVPASPTHPFIPLRPTQRFRGRRLTPFEVMKGITRVLGLHHASHDQEPFPPRRPCPWEPGPSPSSFPSWPILGSASNRSEAQQDTAHEYSNSVVQEHVLLGRLLAFTDGSSVPLPDPEGHSGCAAVFSTDGCTPLSTHRATFRHPSNNVGAEIAGIQLAITAYLSTPHAQDTLVVLTDCQVAVHLCQGRSHPSTQNFWAATDRVLDDIERLRHLGKTVLIEWIPGHCKSPLNSLADDLANSARPPLAPTLRSCTQAVPLGVLKAFARARLLQSTAQSCGSTLPRQATVGAANCSGFSTVFGKDLRSSSTQGT